MNLIEKLGLVSRGKAKSDTDVALGLQKAKMDNLVAEAKKLRKDKARIQEMLDEADEKIEVLEDRVDESREIAKKEIELGDKEALLTALKEGLDTKEAKLKEREARLLEEEDIKDKAAYADGLADGLRKAHEITEKDRENAMKIAMVSAASHTPTETMKELNNVHQLTTGSQAQ